MVQVSGGEPLMRDDAVVYMLWNSQPRTFRGEALAVPWDGTSRMLDAWNGNELDPRRDRATGLARVPVEIAPFGVGCIVVERTRVKATRGEEHKR